MSMNDDYTPIMLRPSEIRKIAKKGKTPIKRGYIIQGAYLHDADRIALVKYNKRQTIEQVKDFNTGERHHRIGFNIKPRRSYKALERKLSGFHKITDVRDWYGRIISHESMHKVIRKIAGQRATRQFDEVYL